MRAHIVIPDDLIAEVDEVVGPRRRSEFFVEAVRDKLRRKRMEAAAEAAAGSLVGVDIPGWETPESTSEWVRALRRESDRRLEKVGWGTPEQIQEAEADAEAADAGAA